MFGERLKELRNKHGMSQHALADKLGIGRATIAGYESKGTQPKYEILIEISRIFNVSIDYLLGNNVVKENQAKYSDEEIKQAREFAEQLGFAGSHGKDLADLDDNSIVEYVNEVKEYAKYLKNKK